MAKRKLRKTIHCSKLPNNNDNCTKTKRVGYTYTDTWTCRSCKSDKMGRFKASSAGLALFKLCMRAKTTETFQSAADIRFYLKIRAYRINVVEKNPTNTEFHLCHKHPLVSNGLIGLTNEHNLLIASKESNLANSNKILTTGINGINFISAEDTDKENNTVDKSKAWVFDNLLKRFPELTEIAKEKAYRPYVSGQLLTKPIRDGVSIFSNAYSNSLKLASEEDSKRLAYAWSDFMANKYPINFGNKELRERTANDACLREIGLQLERYMLEDDRKHLISAIDGLYAMHETYNWEQSRKKEKKYVSKDDYKGNWGDFNL